MDTIDETIERQKKENKDIATYNMMPELDEICKEHNKMIWHYERLFGEMERLGTFHFILGKHKEIW